MGHLGIIKCRARAKTTVFWPNIDRDISQPIMQCDVCCEHQHAPPSYDKHSVEAHWIAFPSMARIHEDLSADSSCHKEILY